MQLRGDTNVCRVSSRSTQEGTPVLLNHPKIAIDDQHHILMAAPQYFSLRKRVISNVFENLLFIERKLT